MSKIDKINQQKGNLPWRAVQAPFSKSDVEISKLAAIHIRLRWAKMEALCEMIEEAKEKGDQYTIEEATKILKELRNIKSFIDVRV